MPTGLEVYEVTKSQLERWSADNPGTFSYTLERGTNLMLASAWRTRDGWTIAAESDAHAMAHAEEFGAWCVEDVSDGYYADLSRP